MSINYGGMQFTNPVPLAFGLAPHDPGIVAIQVRNASYTPLPFQPVAFEASGDLSAFEPESHPEWARWRGHALAGTGLFVSYATLRYESASCRERTRDELIAQYVAAGAYSTISPPPDETAWDGEA